nr:MAG: hypothetical protein [Bacteriophage sp.]
MKIVKEREEAHMRKFEAGKRYGENTVVFEIVKRTAKTITYAAIYHAGRTNEKKKEEKKAKIHEWDGREVFFAGNETVEA